MSEATTTLKEPEGISFFSIRTGETFYAKLEPTIAAMINSSDMGINASRGQDFGWRLAPKWVKLVRDFADDESKMDTLAAKLRLEDGEVPSTTQILNYIYGRQVRDYLRRLKDEEAPFADKYAQDIAEGRATEAQSRPVAQELDEIPEDVDEADLAPADDDDELIPAVPKKNAKQK